jgi:hypothetical protein
MDKYLRTQVKSIHDEKSMIVTKVVVAPKLRARELRLNRGKRNRLKDEMTNRPMITCIMIVIICEGHECNFSQAASRAYK